MKTVIVYGSMTGSTEGIAEDLAQAFDAVTVPANDASAASLEGCDLLILGASTWGMGDLQDDMADFLSKLSSMTVSIPMGAVLGLGDQFGYGETFVDGIADMADALEAKGIKRIGDWPVAGYSFSASRAQVGDQFMGLAIDQDNESDKTAGRLAEWVQQLKQEAGV
jgi:flavodoxin I